MCKNGGIVLLKGIKTKIINNCNEDLPKKYVIQYPHGVNVRTGSELSASKVKKLIHGEYFYVKRETNPITISEGSKRIQMMGK